ncbi:MAG: protease modulator HflC [Pseudomonadota bacterium]
MANRIAIILGVVFFIGAIIVAQTFFIVRETEQALVLRFGQPQSVVTEPGLNVKVPFIETTVFLDKRNLEFDASAEEIPTLDQKQVIVDSFARYRISNPLEFFQTLRNESNAQGRLAAIISSSLRDTISRVPLPRVLTEERASLMDEIAASVNRESAGFGIEIIDVRLKRVDLPEENSNAIFRRMQTQREQEARRIRAEGDRDAQIIRADADKQARVIRADADRQAEILRGEGDAQAERIYLEAYGANAEFFNFYRSLEALRRSATADTTSYVGPPTADFLRMFDNNAAISGIGSATPASAPN